MDNISCREINIQYNFLNDAAAVAKDEKKNPATVFAVEGHLLIQIDQQVYFEESIALLEFYLYLDHWVSNLNEENPNLFDYFTIEIEEEDPLISVIFYNGLGRIQSFWEEEAMNTVFEKEYLVSEWIKLHHRLGHDIERQYALDLKPFKKRPPIRKLLK